LTAIWRIAQFYANRSFTEFQFRKEMADDAMTAPFIAAVMVCQSTCRSSEDGRSMSGLFKA
jgi:hypothetical protein